MPPVGASALKRTVIGPPKKRGPCVRRSARATQRRAFVSINGDGATMFTLDALPHDTNVTEN